MKAISGEGIAIKRSEFASTDANVAMNESLWKQNLRRRNDLPVCCDTNRAGITESLWEGH